MIKKRVVGFFLVILFPSLGNAQQVDIDLSVEHQIIDGFGGMNHTSWVQDFNDDQRYKIFSNTPGNMGLSILRIHIDPDSNRFAEQVPTSSYAFDMGVKVFATPWDPPAELIDESSGDVKLPYENYGAYVNHLNSFNTLMQDSGVFLYAISVQNEPDIGGWASWTPEEIYTFVREFAQDIDNRVIAPESYHFDWDYSDPILNDSIASSHIEIIGGHIYGSGLEDYPLAREKGKQVWMTEHLTGSDPGEVNDWSLALELGEEIHSCMEANFNAYNWWYIRRFYGLMTDDGNISQKGYVMSHYSKFVRPDAIRIDATVSSTNVLATAYKTDTSMAIVAINISADSVELSFNLQNGSYDEMVRFTSTENSFLVNKGVINSSSGNFSVKLEPNSISTLTTSAMAGGAYNNIPPVAVVGNDLLLEDMDGSGNEMISLDGTQSSDSDGEIVNYSWALNGAQIVWTATHELTLPIGNHVITLTVTDNDGARNMDTMNVSVNSIFNTELWFEAECFEVGSTWEENSDELASNGKYVNTPLGTESTGAASTNPDDLLTVTFNVTEEASYKLWGRVITPTANDDSYWVKVDNSEWAMWNSIPAGNDWHWDDVHNGGNDNPVYYQLSAGEHTLYICYREDGALLDKILIANTGIIPSELGGSDEMCGNSGVGLNSKSENMKLHVYPNPSTGNISVEWSNTYNSLDIISPDGKNVMSKEYSTSMANDKLLLNLDPGLYYIVVRNDETIITSRLIIR